MSIIVNMISDNTVEVISQQSQTYNINDLIPQINILAQGIIDSQNQLAQLNAIVSGAQSAGLIIDQSTLIDQTQALPLGSSVQSLLSVKP